MLRELIVLTLTGALAAPLAAAAAEPERLEVPLSDPSRPAVVEVGLVMGSIEIVAGEPGRVVILASSRESDRADRRDRAARRPSVPPAPPVPPVPPTPPRAWREDDDEGESRADRSGMRRIPNVSVGLEVEESDNRVEIGAASWMRPVDLRIEVPKASSIEASTVNDGDLVVRGLSGEISLSNTNGEIRISDVTGPVSASTVNGGITVSFGSTMAKAAMAFSTLNGDVDLTLPGSAAVDVLLRSDNGEIYSDFDVALAPRTSRIEEDRSEGRYRIAIARELAGKIGGGGPEIFLKTFNGDILLRRAK
ncbi:MAG: hypothetical protein AMXMBFR36_06290 [Acidobacteriota bacterium]